MGGKTKQSQRTKNNVRPSSSSRSAEILNQSVNQDGGLMTVGGGKVLPALFPTLATVNLDQGLNPEFQMCIKKLNKKDPITRAKAVQELCDLVNNGNADDVVAALPSWAHFYKALTADTDRKVREVTQVCHHAIMRVCGRRAAPQLKAILPSWLQAQYDEHAPAQTNAQLSLKPCSLLILSNCQQSIFPDSKLPEVISFCKAEVMAHLIENLIGNIEAIISKKIENPEERELQMARIITSSLRGLEYFTPNLPAQHHDWLWGELTPLLESNTHWKYASHNTHQVRAAWYSAMGRIIERYKDQFSDKYGLKLMRILLNSARDTNPQVAAQVWACLLQFMHNIENWHKYLDKKELLVKRILDVLQTGGWGDAKHLTTMLLPLLAHLPQDILTKEFYETFFNAVYLGLEKKNVLISKSEQRAWVTSLAECLRYLSIQQNDFVVEVATSVHRTWLEKILSTQHDAQTRNNLIKCSATNMTSIVKYWLKLSKEGNSEKYDQLLRNFWQNIGSTVLSQIDKCGTDLDEIEGLIDGHITLLQTLKTTFLQETKKQQSIKFVGDEKTAEEKSPVATQQCDASIVERYNHNLEDLVHKICAHYFEAAAKMEVSTTILTPLITLLIEFDSKNLFLALARQFNVDTLYKLYDKVLWQWVAGDTMRCKAVVDIIFLMSKYLSEGEQDAMFDSFKKLTPAVVEWCLSVCMSHPYIEQKAARRWAGSQAAGEAVAMLAYRAVKHNDIKATALLFTCLADGPEGKPLINSRGVSQVMRTVSQEILDYRSPTLMTSASIAARLATTLASTDYATKDTAGYTELVLRLYRLNVAVPRGHTALCVDTWTEILSSWQDGLAALPETTRLEFLAEAAQLLHTELFLDLDKLNLSKLYHLPTLCPYLFTGTVLKGSDQPDDLEEIVAFTKRVFKMDDAETLSIETCALRHLCVTGQMTCLYEEGYLAAAEVIKDSAEQTITDLKKSDLIRYLNKKLFHAIYLKTLLVHKVDSNEDNGEEDPTNSWCNTLLRNNYIRDEYCKMLHFYCIVDALYEGYTFTPYSEILEKVKEMLDRIMMQIIDETSESTREIVLNNMFFMSMQSGYFWSYAHRLYRFNAIKNQKDGTNFTPHNIKIDLSGNGFFHMLEAAVKWSGDPVFTYKTTYIVMLRCWDIAFQGVSKLKLMEEMKEDSQYDFDTIVNAYYERKDTMLYDTDISEAPWAQVVCNAAVLEFMAAMIKQEGWSMPCHHWDFATISLCSILSSICNSMAKWGCTKMALLTRAAVHLFTEVRTFVSKIRQEAIRQQPPAHVMDLLKEWKDMFAPETHDSIFNCIMHVLNNPESMTAPKSQAVFWWVVACTQLRHDALSLARSRRVTLAALVRCAARALRSTAHPSYNHLAYYLIVTLSQDLAFDDAKKLSLWSDESAGDTDEIKDRPVFSLDLFHDTFEHLRELVEAALNHVVPGEAICELVPFTDSHTVTLGWLLLADAMATICRHARGDLTQFYIQVYRDGKYSVPQLTACMRLLPGEVFAFANDNTGNTPAPMQYKKSFLEVEMFSMKKVCSGRDVSALACRGLLTALCGAGCSAARGWWGAARPPVARALERLVIAFVAPHAIHEHFTHLQERLDQIPEAEVRIGWSANEVVCDYLVEESTLQLHVIMSRSHPLTPPRIVAPVVAGPGSNTQWISLFLAYQNGTILNALKMWMQAVNARVEKSPQCYICYCRLHPGTGKLPRVPCHQCKNKFHDMCLRKWFATSNKSNCPLCRANF